jgi:hypothetical protein
MSVLQLEDLIAVYPPQNAQDIQTLVSAKKEFNDLASAPSEPPPPRPGMFFKHQELIGRLMVFMDNLLLIHRTGTGKTCSFVRVAEYFKELQATNSTIRRVYVLVRGPSLKNEFKRQLICTCTDGIYLTDLVKRAVTESTRKSNITRAIKTWYKIKTYGKFVNKVVRRINGMTPAQAEEYIVTKYSNILFFVDEVHNLRIDPASGQNTEEVRLTYAILWKIFHLMQKSKVILASATPMINAVSEIGPIMNLLLPDNIYEYQGQRVHQARLPQNLDVRTLRLLEENQFPANFDYARTTLEMVEPFFRGKISYVRETETGAIPIFEGDLMTSSYEIDGQLVPSQTRVYGSVMSGIQLQGYLQAQQRGSANFWSAQREAADFVFPDLSYGGDGFRRYVIPQGPDRYQASPELFSYLRDLNHLRQLSCKYAEIVRLCMTEPGNCFIYSDYAEIGAILIGLCFEAQGFERFDEADSIFQAVNPGILPPVCSSRTDSTARRVRIAPRRRYALLTGETIQTSEARVHSMMEAFNSIENRHGDYIKIMIGSPVSRDGINLANVLQVHMASAGWNPSSTYQAISRAIRATSHVSLMEELRERLRAQNEPPETVENATINVRIFKHVAINPEPTTPVVQATPRSRRRVVQTEQDTNPPSVDIHMYEMSESKEIRIKRMERFMKQCAIDCQIHYARNVKPTDLDHSSTCDYDICQYVCVSAAPESLDRDTYDILYSEGEINDAIVSITQFFQFNFTLNVDDLYTLLPQFAPKFIDMAIERLVITKAILYDRFGFPGYLREDGGTLFLRRDFPLVTVAAQPNQYGLSIYTSNLIANQITPLPNYVADLQVDEQYDLVTILNQTSPEDPRFNTLLDELNIDTKVSVLESAAIATLVNHQETPQNRAILQKFSNSFYEVNEPVQEIQAQAASGSRSGGRTRRRTTGTGAGTGTRTRTRTLNPESPSSPAQVPVVPADTERVYLHTLYIQVYDRTAYSVNTKSNKAEGRIRLLKPSEGTGWRDTTSYEYPVYNAIIQQLNANRNQPFEAFDISGSILQDKKFRIRNKRSENTARSQRDSRYINKGKECETWLKNDLIDLLWELRIPPPGGNPVEITDPEILINYLTRQNVKHSVAEMREFSLDQLQFYYQWYRTGASRKVICNRIQDHLRDIGRLMVV